MSLCVLRLMSAKSGKKRVWVSFNRKQIALFNEKSSMYTFSQFVREAYFEKVAKVNRAILLRKQHESKK